MVWCSLVSQPCVLRCRHGLVFWELISTFCCAFADYLFVLMFTATSGCSTALMFHDGSKAARPPQWRLCALHALVWWEEAVSAVTNRGQLVV
jgi:hypothetical protein